MEQSHRRHMTGWVQHSSLIWQLAKREMAQRYKSSALGGFWVVAQPLIQLLLYAFVFQVVLRSRWGVTVPNTGREVPFGLILFVGILIHALLAEMLTRGPALVVSNVSFVKRVIFPLEILPVVTMVTAIINVIFGFLILFAGFLLVHGTLTPMAFMIVVPLFFLIVLGLGLGWLLSAFGVYFRDLSQLTTHLSTILMFTAPICYPATMVPEHFRWLLQINPLTLPVESVRGMLFQGTPPDWSALLTYGAGAIVFAWFGNFVFRKLRGGFADVL